MALGFRFVHDEHWLEIDQTLDPQDWATAAADRAWGAAGRAPDWYRQQVFTDQLTVLARGAARLKPVVALVLCPEPAGSPAAVLEVLVADVPAGFTRADAVTQFTAPAAEHAEPPLVTDLDTRAGRAVRVRQRLVTPVEGSSRAVIETIRYGWLVPHEHALLVASISLPDLVTAGRLFPLVDDLARGCEIVNEPAG
jgi:hypothetical protein